MKFKKRCSHNLFHPKLHFACKITCLFDILSPSHLGLQELSFWLVGNWVGLLPMVVDGPATCPDLLHLYQTMMRNLWR